MVINNPGRWQVHWDYNRSGLGMLFKHDQNWRTSSLPFSLSLANRVNTGVSFDTPSGGIAERKRWASRGMQGYGPRIQYPVGAGMDGLGHGCGCGCSGDCSGGGGGLNLVCLAAIAAAAYFLGGRGGLQL